MPSTTSTLAAIASLAASVDGLGRLVAHGDEQLVLHAHAAGGDQPEHALGGLGELLVASEQDVAERVGEAVHAAHPAAADQLLHEEGHALGPQVHLRQLVFVGRPVEDRGRHLPHLPAVEAGEFEPRDTAIAVEFGQQARRALPRPSSSLRKVSTISTRASSMTLIRKRSSPRLCGSTQWRSSITSTTGRTAATFSSTSATAS